MDRIPLLSQMSVESQPVVTGSLHTKDGFIWTRNLFHQIQQLVEANMWVGEAQGFPMYIALPVHNGCFMMSFADVDADDIHVEHSFGPCFVWLRLSFPRIITYLEMRRQLVLAASSGSSMKSRGRRGSTLFSADDAARRKRNPHPYDGIISSAFRLLISILLL